MEASRRLKYALIGCGRIARNHIAAALAADLELVALCDLVPERMQALAEQFELPASSKFYQDYQALLAAEEVEAVAICTESGRHASIAKACLLAGCHCLVEKPLALSLEEADELLHLAASKDLCLYSCHQNRFNPTLQKLRQALDAGSLGDLLYGSATVRWYRDRNYYEQAKWRGTWAEDGGCLMNQCIHNIDLLCWCLGSSPCEVMAYTARLSHDYIEAEDIGLAVLKFPGGRYGILEGSTVAYPANLEETLAIFGTAGSVKIGGKAVNKIEAWRVAAEAESEAAVCALYGEESSNVYGQGHKALYSDFAACCLQGQSPLVPGSAGRAAVEVVLAIYESAATGKAVSLPLQRGSTLDYCGRFAAPSESDRHLLEPLSLSQEVPAQPTSAPATAAQPYFVHESAYVDEGVSIGKGSKIWHFSHLQKGAVLGEACSLGQNVNIGPGVELGDRVRIQNNVSVYTGVSIAADVFLGPSCVFTNVLTPRAEQQRSSSEFALTTVERGVSIGANATIVAGTRLRRYAMVAAGSVVSKDVPAHALVMGVPARQTAWVCACGHKLEFNRSRSQAALQHAQARSKEQLFADNLRHDLRQAWQLRQDLRLEQGAWDCPHCGKKYVYCQRSGLVEFLDTGVE